MGRATSASAKSKYTSAKEGINLKLIDIKLKCLEDPSLEYNIETIADEMGTSTDITIEKYYNAETGSIKSGLTRIANLTGIAVSVDSYSGYKFLIGKATCAITGVSVGEVADTQDGYEVLDTFEANTIILWRINDNKW